MSETQTETESTDRVTVSVWSGATYESYEQILDTEPEEYEIEVTGSDTYFVPHEDHVVLADNVKNHQKYAFHVDTDDVVDLVIETSDSHHDPIGDFDSGRPIEGGLPYAPEGHGLYEEEPFKTEIWGRIRMRVEGTDS